MATKVIRASALYGQIAHDLEEQMIQTYKPLLEQEAKAILRRLYGQVFNGWEGRTNYIEGDSQLHPAPNLESNLQVETEFFVRRGVLYFRISSVVLDGDGSPFDVFYWLDFGTADKHWTYTYKSRVFEVRGHSTAPGRLSHVGVSGSGNYAAIFPGRVRHGIPAREFTQTIGETFGQEAFALGGLNGWTMTRLDRKSPLG